MAWNNNAKYFLSLAFFWWRKKPSLPLYRFNSENMKKWRCLFISRSNIIIILSHFLKSFLPTLLPSNIAWHNYFVFLYHWIVVSFGLFHCRQIFRNILINLLLLIRPLGVQIGTKHFWMFKRTTNTTHVHFWLPIRNKPIRMTFHQTIQ